jgi:2-polyprenyl-3-methyl-5-hydroxy-6-metoxy-1,4-benzoquinol methylase
VGAIRGAEGVLMRPYTRSLHPNDYEFLQDSDDLRAFVDHMAHEGVPHREWHPHRIWEYASIMLQLRELGVPRDAEIVDVGAGASFFDPYLALRYPKLCEIDSMKYGDVTDMVEAQRAHYGVALPLYDLALEDLSPIQSDRFDVSMCISTIEHVDDHDAAMRELVRITKPGGYIFITSDYFRSREHWEMSISKHLQVTPYTKELVLNIPNQYRVEFVGRTDLDYLGDFVHNYSFVNICLRKLSHLYQD